MSGKKIIEGAKESLAVARGGQPAARIIVNGHAYVPEKSATGYAQGFEACREAASTAALAQRCERGTSWDMACTTIAAAIAALPASAGVEVTVEELVRIIDPGASALTREYNYAIDLAKQLLAAFTILAKPTQEGQGS